MAVTRHSTGTIEIKLSLTWANISAELEKQTLLAVSQTELPGFRKGKAPRSLIEPKLDKSQLLSQSLSALLPPAYTAMIEAEHLKPILYPQIQINQGKWGTDFEFTATTCESPTVALPEKYPDHIKKLQFKDQKDPLPDILEYLHANSKVAIPDPLVEQEADHRLSHLAENLTQLGMDMAKYLTGKKITAADLKAQTAVSTRTNLEMEFILGTLQAQEKLSDRKATLDFLSALPKT